MSQQTVFGNSLKGLEMRRKIAEYLKTCAVPPTIREIGDAMGLSSSSTVFCHLRKMEREGTIYRKASSPRSIMFANPTVTPEGRELPSVSRLYSEAKQRCDTLENALSFLLSALEYEDLACARTAKAIVRAKEALKA